MRPVVPPCFDDARDHSRRDFAGGDAHESAAVGTLCAGHHLIVFFVETGTTARNFPSLGCHLRGHLADRRYGDCFFRHRQFCAGSVKLSAFLSGSRQPLILLLMINIFLLVVGIFLTLVSHSYSRPHSGADDGATWYGPYPFRRDDVQNLTIGLATPPMG